MSDRKPTGPSSQKHICLFYESEKDLLEMVGFYFREALRKNELCAWIVPGSIGIEAARAALGAAIADFGQYVEKKQIRLIGHESWYVQPGKNGLESVLDNWTRLTEEALGLGFAGLCVSGDGTTLKRLDWDDLINYERRVEAMLRGSKMRALCTYSLKDVDTGEMMLLSSCHDFSASQKGRQTHKLPR